ncbi:MAG: DUF4870 domain-containing protein [Dethiobacter sp.]|nr:DUF4870 domain-containing protein [Dethiobacter sp.]
MQCHKCAAVVKQGAEKCGKCGVVRKKMLDEIKKSSIGMDENVAAASSYAFLFLSGLFFLAVERKSRFVRFHALQGAVTLFVVFVTNIALAFVPGFGILLAIVLWLLNLILIVNLFLKALSGEWYMLPVVGRWAWRWATAEKP